MIEFNGMAEGEIYKGAMSRESHAQSGRQDRRAELWAVCSVKTRSGLKRMNMRKASLTIDCFASPAERNGLPDGLEKTTRMSVP